MLDDLGLNVVQGEINVPRFPALSFCPVALGVPKLFGNGLLATELGYGTVDCHPSHNRNKTVFLLTAVHVKQHFECTSHNPICFCYKISYQQVIHCYAK
jgi:hypothetical protein